jgi:hypothetical protein
VMRHTLHQEHKHKLQLASETKGRIWSPVGLFRMMCALQQTKEVLGVVGCVS